MFIYLLYGSSLWLILSVFLWYILGSDRKKTILEFQNKIEKKLKRFKKISFKQFLYTIIAGCGIQALTQYLTVEYPDPWMENEVLEFYNDPAFYLGLMLTFMIALLIIRKWKG